MAPGSDGGQCRLWLLKSIVLGNLVTRPTLVHTRFTYHRTWETGLEVAAKTAIANPEFFCARPAFTSFPLAG